MSRARTNGRGGTRHRENAIRHAMKMLRCRAEMLWAIAKATYEEWAAYRTHSMVSIFVGPVYYLVQYFIWNAVFTYGQTLGGMTLSQMLTYAGVAAVIGYKSAIITPTGATLAESTNYFDYVTRTINLDCAVAHLDYNRDKIIAMKEKYKEAVEISDPGDLASVLLTSHSYETDIKTMIQEFNIELLDEYLPRALACHNKPENIEK